MSIAIKAVICNAICNCSETKMLPSHILHYYKIQIKKHSALLPDFYVCVCSYNFNWYEQPARSIHTFIHFKCMSKPGQK